MDQAELDRLVGDRRPGLIGDLQKAGYVTPGTGGTWNVPSPTLLDHALRLFDAGIDVEISGHLRDVLRKRLAKAVEEMVKEIVDRVGAGFAGAATPDELAIALGDAPAGRARDVERDPRAGGRARPSEGWSSAARRPRSRPGVADSRPVRPRWPAMDENTADDTATRPTSLGEELAGLAVADPDRPAVTFGDITLSRAELEARTNRLARAYQALGVTPDSFVTIGLPNGIEFVEATIATWKVGATPQPISHRLPPVERQAIIELADPSLLVGVDRDGRRRRPSVPEGFEPDPGLSTGPLEPRIAASLKAPTSGGSTGRPKLIVSGSPAVLSGVTGMAALGRMRPDGVALCTGPLHHNGPFLAAFGALFIGSHVVVMPKFDAEQSLMLIERHRVDWMYAVPTMMLRIWRLPVEVRTAYDVSSLAAVLHLAAPCPEWLKREWIDWLGPERILELYAGTEAQLVTFLDGTEWLAHPGSVGRPLFGELQIRDADGNVLPPGEVGSVWMRGPDGAPSDVSLRRCDGEGGCRRVGDARRRRPPRRGRLPVPRRPGHRHDPRRRLERLSRRGRGRVVRASGRRRRVCDRDPGRRPRQRAPRDHQRERARPRRRAPRPPASAALAVQDPPHVRAGRGTAPRRRRQGSTVGTPG